MGGGRRIDTDKLRVLLVAPSLRKIGGQSVQAALLLHELARIEGITATIQPIDPALPGFLGRLQTVKFVRTLVTIPLYVVQLFWRVPTVDVLHVFSASYFSFLLSPTPAVLVGRLFRKPVVLNYHSGEAEEHLLRWPSAVRLLRSVDRIIVPSPYLGRVFAKFGLRSAVIANMVDLTRFRFQVRGPVSPTFLVNRNFEAHYNVELVLRAFQLIQARIPAATLTVAGDGPERDKLANLAKELRLANARFVGRVKPEDMADLYDRHDVWLNGSDVDNMPLSILECFASGTAVVSTNAGGIPDMVDDGRTGLLANCGDSGALAENAIRVVTNPSLHHRLSSAGRLECAKYSRNVVVPSWVELYWSMTGTVRCQ